MPRRVLSPASWLRRPRAEPDRTERLDFETFFRFRYRGMVRYLIIGEAADPVDAEDAVVGAMSDAFRNWATIENPEAWVRRAARHALVGLRRQERRRHQLAIDAVRGAVPARERHDAGSEDVRAVADLLRCLPPAQREIMALTVDDYTPAEIAEIIGKDPQTVRSNLRAARRTLAEIIRFRSTGGEVTSDDQRR